MANSREVRSQSANSISPVFHHPAHPGLISIGFKKEYQCQWMSCNVRACEDVVFGKRNVAASESSCGFTARSYGFLNPPAFWCGQKKRKDKQVVNLLTLFLVRGWIVSLFNFVTLCCWYQLVLNFYVHLFMWNLVYRLLSRFQNPNVPFLTLASEDYLLCFPLTLF